MTKNERKNLMKVLDQSMTSLVLWITFAATKSEEEYQMIQDRLPEIQGAVARFIEDEPCPE